jgi:hypothetical protein
MDDTEKRKRFKAYCAEYDRVTAERNAIEIEHDRATDGWSLIKGLLRRGGLHQPPSLPDHPPFPDELRSMTCAAKTRAGTPCKLTSIYSNGRCKLHGGLSTGPRTAAGKLTSAANGQKPKRKRTS